MSGDMKLATYKPILRCENTSIETTRGKNEILL